MNFAGKIRFVLAVLLVVIFSGLVVAQEPETDPQDDPLDKIRKKGVQNPAIIDPEVLIEVYRDDFRHWPRNHVGVEAVRKVIDGGQETIPILLRLLDHRDYRIKPAVAHILGQIVIKEQHREEAWAKIEPLLQHPKLKASYRSILQALHGIDRERAELKSLELLESESSALRQAAFHILDEGTTSAYKDALAAMLKTSKGETRHKVFLLMAKEPDEEIDDAALDLIGDEHPSLAAAVNAYLGGRNTDRVKSALNSRLRYEPDRTFAFTLAALVTLENNFNLELLHEEMISGLEHFLIARDPLFRVCAASALANICSRTGREADVNRIRNRIVPTLMDVFLKNKYFKDFNCMLEIAAASLSKVTGAPFSRDLTYWHTWWSQEGRSFVGRQFLIRVDPDQIPRIVIAYQAGSADSALRFTLRGEGFIDESDFEHETETLILSTQDMESLVDFFYAKEFFERRSLVSPELAGSDDLPLIEMEVEGRTRIIAPDSTADAGFNAMEEKIRTVYRSQIWQELFPGGDFRSWWDNRYTWWKEQNDPQKKTLRLLEDLIEALETLPDDTIVRCADLMKDCDLEDSLNQDDVKALLSGLSKRHWKIDSVVEAVVDIIVAAGDPDSLDPLILYLYGTYNREAFPLLRRAMIDLNGVERSFDDPQWFVRAIAAEACLEKGSDGVSLLIPLAGDPEPEVRLIALRGLASLDSKRAMDVLMNVMTGEDPQAKIVVLQGMKGVQSPWAIALYDEALKGDEETLWPLALEGLGEIPTQQATQRIVAFIQKIGFRHEASRSGWNALLRMGGPAARDALAQLYDACHHEDLKKELLFARASLGETSIFPDLMECLFDKVFRQNALDAMAFLLVADYGDELWKYRERFDKFPHKSQAYFLKDALGLTAAAPEGEPSFEEIPVAELVGALRHELWPVRESALRILEEGSEVTFGDLKRDASPEEIADLASAWEAWAMKNR